MNVSLATRIATATFAGGVAALAFATPAHASTPDPVADSGGAPSSSVASAASPTPAPGTGWGQLALGAGAGIAVSGLGVAVVAGTRRRQLEPA